MKFEEMYANLQKKFEEEQKAERESQTKAEEQKNIVKHELAKWLVKVGKVAKQMLENVPDEKLYSAFISRKKKLQKSIIVRCVISSPDNLITFYGGSLETFKSFHREYRGNDDTYYVSIPWKAITIFECSFKDNDLVAQFQKFLEEFYDGIEFCHIIEFNLCEDTVTLWFYNHTWKLVDRKCFIEAIIEAMPEDVKVRKQNRNLDISVTFKIS